MLTKNASFFLPKLPPDKLFTIDGYESGMAAYRAARTVEGMIEGARARFGFLSAPGAAGFMGAAWWLALIAALEDSTGLAFWHALDCGGSAAYALGAVRMGQKHAVLQASAAQFNAIKAVYTQEFGMLLSARPPSFHLIPSLCHTSSLVGYFTDGYCQSSDPENKLPDTRQKKDCYP
ncbi:hypothetical protein FKW31_01905 [Acetobacter sp. DmW_136]|uniref:hypothetical protein n=1 Tax=Acetobacter sp. DmW_136 TaxID=2591091 RepID=UPI0012392535|nr:hypothetical protein [Acetobacter sp. DmW_136]KAA8387943.1 hypothetical protein FKW31_01905 [Acetobacter sp. DmW_136]